MSPSSEPLEPRTTVDARLTPALIERYATRAPRYTSYPTAVEFTPMFGNAEWQAALKERFGAAESSTRPVSLYAHIPFCRSLCYFCACNKIITQERTGVRAYLDAVFREIAAYGTCFEQAPEVAQLHWGGGSPNFLLPAEMRELFDGIRRTFPRFTANADISIELDPRTTSFEQLETLRALGFNRVSLGVQDFEDAVQRAVNRVQSYESTIELCSETRRLGFGGLNVDLIYGLPLQTVATFSSTLEKICAIRPDRIALYGYAHVTWIRKVQKVFEKTGLPSPEERVELFLTALKKLTAEGYEYIGMDHFALPTDALAAARRDGTLHRNFMGYTTHKTDTLLGFGVSSISSLPTAFAQNEKEIGRYQSRVGAEGLAIERGVARTAEDRRRGAIIQELLCQGTVDLALHRDAQDDHAHAEDEAAIRSLAPLAEDGLLVIENQSLTVTELGRIFARNIAAAFDAYLPLHQAKETPVFSKAV